MGPSAGPLLTAAVKKRKVAKVITVLGAVTVIAGWILWLKNMSQYPSLGDWVTSSFGLVLTIGGVLATISAFVGSIGVRKNVERAVDLGGEIAASGVRRRRNNSHDWMSSGRSWNVTGRPTSSCWFSPSSRWRPLATGSGGSAGLKFPGSGGR